MIQTLQMILHHFVGKRIGVSVVNYQFCVIRITVSSLNLHNRDTFHEKLKPDGKIKILDGCLVAKRKSILLNKLLFLSAICVPLLSKGLYK